MARDWIDQGFRQQRAREGQLRLASERRLEHAAVVKERAPDLMRRLVAEVSAAVTEYQENAGVKNDIEFEELPHEGFSVRKTTLPRVALECRPGYETHIVYCNRTRIDGPDSDVQEIVFNLDMTVDLSNRIVLRHETVELPSVGDAVEFLLKPVLFPTFDSAR